jgi:hypothetical protein
MPAGLGHDNVRAQSTWQQGRKDLLYLYVRRTSKLSVNRTRSVIAIMAIRSFVIIVALR